MLTKWNKAFTCRLALECVFAALTRLYMKFHIPVNLNEKASRFDYSSTRLPRNAVIKINTL